MPRRRPSVPPIASSSARAAAALALIATALALSACGGDDEPTTTAASAPPETPQKQADTPAAHAIGDGEGGVELDEIGSFDQPVYVTQPPAADDALYVVEQTGRVQRVEPGGAKSVFLDLSDQVSCCGEQGLLSIAFAPDYAKSGLLYASFTNTDGDSRVVEFERSENGKAANPRAAQEIFSQDQPFSNHNGGLVLFGPDGRLYLGLGDGGSAGDPDRNGQDPDTYLGKLLRFGDLDGSPPEIFALGLRNPWRYSFNPKTDDLWIGDVGQQSLEEIDGVTFEDAKGANFGWSAYEGTERYNDDQQAPGAVPPVLTYSHGEGCSVTGGYVVRDRDLTSLYGRYLYGDYCAGELRSFPARPGRIASDDRELGVEVPGLSSFGEDAEGHVYAVSVEGPVYRLEPPAAE